MKIQFIKDENYQTMYIDNKRVLSGHSLDAEEVAQAIVGFDNVTIVDTDEFDEDKVTFENGSTYYLNTEQGKMMYWNDDGHPEEYPF